MTKKFFVGDVVRITVKDPYFNGKVGEVIGLDDPLVTLKFAKGQVRIHEKELKLMHRKKGVENV